MTLDPTSPRKYTIEEYLRLEAAAVEKHEYRDGEIVAMSGGSVEHSLIITNLIGELRQRLKGKPCRVYESNLRVRIPHSTLYTYPDLSVICGEPQFDPQDRRRTTVLNPRVLFEVLSEGTEAYDRGDKFRRYIQIESLQEYVLFSQQTPFGETFFRRGDGSWLFTPAAGMDAVIRFQSLAVELPMAEVYAGVRFPPEPEGPAAV